MRRVVVLAAVVTVAGSVGTASAAGLTLPAWAKPLIAPLMLQRQARVLPVPAPALPAPTVRGFTCYIAAIGSAIALGGASPCDRPAFALPILGL